MSPRPMSLPLRRGAPAMLAAAVPLVGCGGTSKQDQAKKTVCSAKTDIAAKVDDLKTLPPTVASLPAAKTDVSAIVADLQKIKDAQGDLDPGRKQAVTQANQQFSQAVQSALAGLSTNLSLSTAKTQIAAAVEQLATSYQQAFARVDCGS